MSTAGANVGGLASRVAAVLALLGPVACGGAKSITESTTCSGANVLGGTSVSSLLGASERVRAIVAVSIGPTEGDARPALCSGVVIGPNALLTAKHCLDLDDNGVWDQSQSDGRRSTTIVVGSPLDPGAPRLPVKAAALHPSLDVALLEGDFAEAAGAFLEPELETLGPEWVGAPVEIAGYGNDELGSAGQLHFAVEPVARIEDDFVVVDGRGRTGACVGDSGGALLGRSDDGVVRVLGVLDHGDRSCEGEDFYLRLAALGAWEPLAAVIAPSSVSSCDALDAVGACLRGRAMWCEGTVPRGELCGAHEVCGWDHVAAGFRCVPASDDPCGGEGSFRTCVGNSLRSCEAGVVQSATCSACSVCMPWSDAAGAACVSPLERPE